MKKLILIALCTVSLCRAEDNPPKDDTIVIRVKSKENDANIVFNVQVSGSNEKDIAKIVDLVTATIEQRNEVTNSPDFKTALLAASIPTGVGIVVALGMAIYIHHS